MSNRIYHQQPVEEDDDRHSISSSASLTLTESDPLLPSKNLDHTTIQQEFHWIFYNSLPIIGTYLLQSSFQFASIFTLGHLVKYNLVLKLRCTVLFIYKLLNLGFR